MGEEKQQPWADPARQQSLLIADTSPVPSTARSSGRYSQFCLNWLAVFSNLLSKGASGEIPASCILWVVNSLHGELCSLLPSTTRCGAARELGQSQLLHIRFSCLIGIYAVETLWTCSRNSPIKYILPLKTDKAYELAIPFLSKTQQ